MGGWTQARTAPPASAGARRTPHAFYATQGDWITASYAWQAVPFPRGPLAEDPASPAQGESFERGDPPVTYDGERIQDPSGATFSLVLEFLFETTPPEQEDDQGIAVGLGYSWTTFLLLLYIAPRRVFDAFRRMWSQRPPPPRLEWALDIGPDGAPIPIKPKGVALHWGEGMDSYHTDSFAGATFQPNGARVLVRLAHDVQTDPDGGSPPAVRVRAKNLTLNSN